MRLRRPRKHLVRACLLVILAGALAVWWCTPASAEELYACNDQRVLDHIEQHCRSLASQGLTPGDFVALKESREGLLGEPPAGANIHATAATYVALSRYCEGHAVFMGGKSEPVYWRIDLIKDESGDKISFDICNCWFDIFEDGCQAFRPQEALE